jgi:hypothetical protein
MPVVRRLFTSTLEALLGPARDKQEPLTQRHKDIARSVPRRFCASAPRRPSWRARWWGGSRGGRSGGLGPGEPLDRVRSAPGGHEGHSEFEDQAPEVVPSLCPFDSARGGEGVV